MGAIAVHAAAGPRFEIAGAFAPDAALLRSQVRRAIRSLVGQRGGSMLLHAWGSGAVVRIECAVAGATANVAIRCEVEAVAAVLREASDAIAHECARCGCALARIECAGPASVVLPAA